MESSIKQSSSRPAMTGKLREFQRLAPAFGMRHPEPGEIWPLRRNSRKPGSTFAENARIESACLFPSDATSPCSPTIRDWKWLRLEGGPGIHSARYAGAGASDADRIRKLLGELHRSSGGRDARFVCTLALAQQGALLLESEGECRGIIAEEPRGTNGFGYDPVFFFPEPRQNLTPS